MNKEKILTVLGEDNVRFDEPLKDHTSFKIGGPADALVIVSNAGELKKTIEYAKAEGEEFFLLGNGSNVLASDEGYRGIVIKLEGEFDVFRQLVEHFRMGQFDRRDDLRVRRIRTAVVVPRVFGEGTACAEDAEDFAFDG